MPTKKRSVFKYKGPEMDSGKKGTVKEKNIYKPGKLNKYKTVTKLEGEKRHVEKHIYKSTDKGENVGYTKKIKQGDKKHKSYMKWKKRPGQTILGINIKDL